MTSDIVGAGTWCYRNNIDTFSFITRTELFNQYLSMNCNTLLFRAKEKGDYDTLFSAWDAASGEDESSDPQLVKEKVALAPHYFFMGSQWVLNEFYITSL